MQQSLFSFHFYSLINLIIQSFITVFIIKRCDFGVLTKMDPTRLYLAWILSWLPAICSQSWLFILFIQCSRSKADKLISLYDPLHNVAQFHFKLTWHSVLTWQIWIWNRQTLFEMIMWNVLITSDRYISQRCQFSKKLKSIVNITRSIQ